MSSKKLGVALLAIFVLGAVMANSAFAENEFSETGAQFYTEIESGKLERMPVGKTDDLEVTGPSGFLTSTIATKPIKISSTGVSGTECSAINPTTTKATLDCKALVFSGVTISGEAATGCSAPTTITTTSKGLTGVIGMGGAGTKETVKITPKEGTTLVLFELTGTCANAGLYKVTGSVFGEASNPTETFALTQKLTFSEAIQKSAGTATSLKFGESGAFLNGRIEATEKGGKPWGSKKE